MAMICFKVRRVSVVTDNEGHTVFQSQLEAVDRPIPRARMGRGKISPMTTHAVGPQVAAKHAMARQMKAISAFVPALLFTLMMEPMIATLMHYQTVKACMEIGSSHMNWQVNMPRPP